MISVYFENRDFTPYQGRHWERLEVDKFSKSAEFGCKRATIDAYGDEADLWQFIKMLRCPVYLSDTRDAKRKWWGYIHGVTIFTPSGFNYGLSLDTMSNSVGVVHTYQKKRYTVAFDTDAASVAKYGRKDFYEQAANKSTAEATQLRDTVLQATKEPMPQPSFSSSGGYSLARLDCRGWYETLGWRYYSNDAGKEFYDEVSGSYGSREIGEDDRPIAAQSFQLASASGWTATSIWLRVSKKGTPADNLQVDLYDDSSSHPNASLTGGATTLAGANINTYSEWKEFVLTTPVAMSTGTTYWIHISRSGAVNASNYFIVGGSVDLGYDDGELKLWNGASWASWSINSDLHFRITGESATTTQISDCISSVGSFFVGCNIINASGVESSPYRDGDATALYEITKLMQTGTTNNRRLLARVTDNRFFEVYEEPDKASADYYIDANRNVTDSNDKPVLPSSCIVGKWMRLKDVMPASASAIGLANPSPCFVEEAEYTAKTDTYTPTKMRGAKQILALATDAG